MRRDKLYLVWVCLIAWGVAVTANADNLRLPPIFASGMVLQQQTDVEVWGWAMPDTEVTLQNSWDKKVRSCISDADGRWILKIATPKASYTAQTLSIKSKNEHIELSDVLIGDVWFVSGQSNMQMDFTGNPDQPVENAQEILLKSRHKNMRLFKVEPGYAFEQSDTISINGAWYPADPDNVKKFSVVGYVFGKNIHSLADIPIGLVQSAHGGSVAEAWLDRSTLERFGGFDLDLLANNTDKIWYSLSPMVLYNKMLAPLLPLSIKGVIWYQGEANVERPEQYEMLFCEMIRTWRKYFKNEELPFYYVQIAPYNYGKTNSAKLREAQLKVLNKMENVGMVVTLDVGEPTIIHPARKQVIGERLAYWALNCDYGFKAFECRGPEFRSMEVKDKRAVLKFDYAPNGLSFYGKQPAGFEVAGEDRIFHPAQVRIVPAFWGNEGLEVWSEKVAQPVAVRYGFTNYVDGTLYNTAGLPASSFRTDDWDVE